MSEANSLITDQDETASTSPGPAKRVLVAEDSPVTQDLLKLILTQRGHRVDVAEDGEQALTALEKSFYDVALIDFRLPKLDGLEVAQRYRGKVNGNARSRLIAITADVEGLLSHNENCENFDQIIPKPLDIYDVCNVIESTQALDPAAAGETGSPDAAPGPDADGAPHPEETPPRRAEPKWTIGFELLRWPDDFRKGMLPGLATPAFHDIDSIDAILICAPARLADLSAIWERRPLHLFPIIDLDGALGPFADFDASRPSISDGEEIRQLIQSFHQRRAQLHRDLLAATEIGEKLLGRMFVKDAPLAPAYDPARRSLVRYNAPIPTEELTPEAERQTRNGFLRRDFFDRFHLCYRCSSSRVHIREECAACHSSQLSEQPYIHHFKCGYQSVESDFRKGDGLVCPKCRQELDHFSVDYDKPGALILCGRCGHAESEPNVGFVCMDCLAHFDSDAAGEMDVYAYHLTQEGIAFMQMGDALRGPGQRTIRFSDLPLDFVVALNTAAKAYNEQGTPFSVVNLAYENEREIVREAGVRPFSQARDLFLDALRNALRDRATVAKGNSYDFCLLHGLRPDSAQQIVMDAADAAQTTLRFDLGLRPTLFGPEDFA